AEYRSNQSATTRANRSGNNVALDVVLFFNNLSLGDFHVLTPTAFAVLGRFFDGKQAHLDRNEATVNFDRSESKIQIGFAAENGETAGLVDGSDDSVDASANGKNELVADRDRFGDDCHERIAVPCGA